MPIYAYKCGSCGHAKDVLQKMSDAPLSVCPKCGAASFAKQVTAAGFQLKGSGWYVTDFRDNGKKKDAKAGESASAATGDAAKGEAAKSDTSKTDTSKSDGAAKSDTATNAAKPAESAAPASSPPPATPTSGA